MGADRPAELPAVLTIHWGWLLAASVVVEAAQSNLKWLQYVDVFLVWSFVQAWYLLKLDKRSTALYWYLGSAISFIVAGLLSSKSSVLDYASASLGLLGTLVGIAGIFIFRRDMTRYFNEIDDVGLGLSPWMTLFFSMIYFQYHFHDIFEFKKRHSVTVEEEPTG